MDAGQPAFVRNLGNEAGIYLRYIADHYHELRNVTLFVQDDTPESAGDLARCLRRDVDFGWAPLSGFYDSVSLPSLDAQTAEHRLATACSWHLARDFGLDAGVLAVPGRNYYFGAQFAASRAQLQRHPRSAYVRAYERFVGRPNCRDGAAWNGTHGYRDHRPEDIYVAERNGWYLGVVFEFSVHTLLGGHPWDMAEWGQPEWCARFRHADDCPGSPCGGSNELL